MENFAFNFAWRFRFIFLYVFIFKQRRFLTIVFSPCPSFKSLNLFVFSFYSRVKKWERGKQIYYLVLRKMTKRCNWTNCVGMTTSSPKLREFPSGKEDSQYCTAKAYCHTNLSFQNKSQLGENMFSTPGRIIRWRHCFVCGDDSSTNMGMNWHSCKPVR